MLIVRAGEALSSRGLVASPLVALARLQVVQVVLCGISWPGLSAQLSKVGGSFGSRCVRASCIRGPFLDTLLPHSRPVARA